MDNDDTQRTIYSLLLTLGFQPTVDGFRYILIGFEFILPDEPVRIKGFIAVMSDFISNKDFMSRMLIERLTDIKSREAYDIAD